MVETQDHLGAGLEVGRVQRAVEVAGREVAGGEADRRPALRHEPRAGLVGEREPPGFASVAVLLREDVRHVLVRDGALEAADDAGGEPVGVILPRAAAVPLEPLEPGPQRHDDADAWEVAQLAADTHLVLDEHVSRVEDVIAVEVHRVVPLPAPRDAVHELEARLRRTRRFEALLEAVEAELEPAREHARAALRQQPQAVVVGRRAPELQARTVHDHVAPVHRELGEDALLPAHAAHPRRAARDAPARPRGYRELLPGDLVTRRCPLGRRAQEEAEGDEALAGARRQVELDLERLSGRDAEPRQRAALHRVAVGGQLPGAAQPVEAREGIAVRDPEPARGRPTRPIRAGRET